MPFFEWSKNRKKQLGTAGAGTRLDAAIRQAPERLQALLLRDDIGDLPSALSAVSALPGLLGVALRNSVGEPLSEHLDRGTSFTGSIGAVAQLLAQSVQRFRETQPGNSPLPESVTYHLGTQQVTGFTGDAMHLIIIHSPRPFRPGVREKVRAFFDELIRLSQLAGR